MGLEQDRETILADFADKYLPILAKETPQQDDETSEDFKNRVIAGVSTLLNQRVVELEQLTQESQELYMAKIFKHRTDVAFFDYKDFKTLQRYVNQYGQIESRKKTGLTESQQRHLAAAIKRARHLALLPFVSSN